MVIRFHPRPKRDNPETRASSLTHAGPFRLSAREIAHRERMLRHLARTRLRRPA